MTAPNEFRVSRGTFTEQLANYFAGCVLMPRKWLARDYAATQTWENWPISLLKVVRTPYVITFLSWDSLLDDGALGANLGADAAAGAHGLVDGRLALFGVPC